MTTSRTIVVTGGGRGIGRVRAEEQRAGQQRPGALSFHGRLAPFPVPRSEFRASRWGLQAGQSAALTPAVGRGHAPLGVILDHIDHARRLGLPYLYLGYWIGASDKMAYKARFRPIEAFQNGRWSIMTTPDDARRGE